MEPEFDLSKFTLAKLCSVKFRGLYIGKANEDPELLFYWLSGYLWHASSDEQRIIRSFTKSLERTYGGQSSMGWYYGLMKKAKSKVAAVGLFFREYAAFIKSTKRTRRNIVSSRNRREDKMV